PLSAIFPRTPDAFSGDAHRAEAETMDLVVATDLERARFACVERTGRAPSQSEKLLRMCARSGSAALLTSSADIARSSSAWLARAFICSSQNVTCSRAISTGFFAPARLRAK